MDPRQLIGLLNHAVPLGAGALLAAVGVSRKYPTVLRYVYTAWAAWVYIILSAFGSLLTTYITRSVGTRLIVDETLNCILLGLFGAAIFLGIISRVAVGGSDKDVAGDLKTIRAYVYEFLDQSIARRVMQSVESKIKSFNRSDREQMLYEAGRLIGAPSELTAEQKHDYRIKFDEYASRGDYVSIVRILIKFYDVDYVIRELEQCVQSESVQLLLEENDPPREGSVTG